MMMMKWQGQKEEVGMKILSTIANEEDQKELLMGSLHFSVMKGAILMIITTNTGRPMAR